MADIDIQKKPKGWGFWPLILGLLALALVVWLVIELVDTDDEVEQAEVVEPVPVPGMGEELAQPGDTTAVATVVNDYITFVEEQDTMGLSHEYTATALTHLAQALNAIVDAEGGGDLELEATRDTLLQRAEMIQQDPQATTHTRSVHAAFTTAAELMGQLQEMRFPELNAEVSQVQQAAQAVSPEGNLLDQQQEVNRFFTAAGDALEQMAGEPAPAQVG